MLQLFKNGMAWMFLGVVLSLFIDCSDRSPLEETQSFNLSDPEKRIHIIIRVQDAFYLNADFEKHLQTIVGDEFKTLDLVSLSRLIDNFIEEKVLLAAAKNNNLSLSWQEQRQYLAKAASHSFPEEDVPLNEMEAQSLLERFLTEKYLYEMVKDIEVEQDEINNYYELNKREFLRPERVSVSQILIDTEDKAVEIFNRVSDSSKDVFQKIAKEDSLGAEAANGGHMGIFEMSQLPVEMERVIFSLKEGETSLVVESAYGFHIFRLDKKLEPELQVLEKVSTDIRMKILDQKIKQFVSLHLLELKDTMDWEFYPKNLSFPYQRNSNE